MRLFLVPPPPLQEQQRIVAKVDQLMTLCDELEVGLVQAQTDGGKLMGLLYIMCWLRDVEILKSARIY